MLLKILRQEKGFCGKHDSDLALVILIALPGPTQSDSELPPCCNLLTAVHIAVILG